MNRRYYLEKAAVVLDETDWEQVTGSRATADYLESSINTVFGDRQFKTISTNYHRGFTEMIKTDLPPGSSFEELLRHFIDYNREIITKALPSDQRAISGYVIGVLSAVKAVVDHLEKGGL